MVILQAARRLALRDGVANVTLGQIAEEVGLAKSNVLRYFETREEIYLQLTAQGWRDWASGLQQRLIERPRKRAMPAARLDLAAALVETLVGVPLFCPLLAEISGHLEHNVSAGVVRTFKLEVMSLIAQLAQLLAKALPPTNPAQAAEIISATVLIAGAAWPIAHPPPQLATLYASDPQMVVFCFDYEAELRRLVLALIIGFASRA